MRDLIQLTYTSGNEPCFVDPEQVIGITPAPAHVASGGSTLLMEWGHEIHVAETATQCYARLKQGNTPATRDVRPGPRRPKLSRRSNQDGGQQE